MGGVLEVIRGQGSGDRDQGTGIRLMLTKKMYLCDSKIKR